MSIYLLEAEHLNEERAKSHYLSYVRHIGSAARETLQEESFPLRKEYQSWLQEAGETVRSML